MMSDEVLIGLWVAVLILAVLARRKLRLLWWARRGRACRQSGDWKRCAEAYDQVIQLAPGVALAYNERAVARLHQGRPDDALRDLAKALELDPRLGLALYNRGAVRARQGDLHGALEDLAKGMEFVDRKAEEARAGYRAVQALIDLGEGLQQEIARTCDVPELQVSVDLTSVTVRWAGGSEPGDVADFALARLPPGSRVDRAETDGGQRVVRMALPEEPSNGASREGSRGADIGL